MHRFNGYHIELTRGDSLSFRINLAGRDLPEGSVGLFTVKAHPRDEAALIQKRVDAGGEQLSILLTPQETNLTPRTYFWDVRILIPLEEGGWEVETPMEYASFTILEAIGRDFGVPDNPGVDADAPVLSVLIQQAREAIARAEEIASHPLDETLAVAGAAAEAKAVGDALQGKLNSGAGAVKREHIADQAINGAKLNYESVSNAKVAPGTLQADRLSDDAQTFLTSGPYLKVEYNGSSRLDVIQGKHTYALRLINNESINLNTWLINHTVYNGEQLFAGMDIEGPLKMLGRSDFIGGIHGDERMTAMRAIADGVELTGEVSLSGVRTLAVYVHSTVYDENGGEALFNRVKTLTFTGRSLRVENQWTYVGAQADKVERWPGCGLYSVFVSRSAGYTTNATPFLSLEALPYRSDVNEAAFWVDDMLVRIRALEGMTDLYKGGVEFFDGSAPRLKAYFHAIHAADGYTVSPGDVLRASFLITME